MNIVCVFFEFDENFLKKLTKAGLILDEGVSVDCLLGEVSGEVIGVANFNGCDILISKDPLQNSLFRTLTNAI